MMQTRSRLKVWLWCGLAFIAFFWSSYADYTLVQVYRSRLETGEIRLKGEVIRAREFPGGAYIDIIPEGIFWGNSAASLRVFCEPEKGFRPGDSIMVQAESNFAREKPPRHWAWWNPYSLEGYTLNAYSGGIRRPDGRSSSLRSKLIGGLWKVNELPSLTKGLLLALVLGDRSYLDPNFREMAARLGISHLLAVSGMHMGLYLLFFSVLVGRGRGKVLAQVLTIVSFALLSGGSAASLRALSCAIYFLIAGRGDLRVSTREGLLRVVLTLLWMNPAYLFDLGFRLSFCAVWAIAFAARGRAKGLDGLMDLLEIGFSVSAFLAPLTAAYFGYVSIWGPLLTLIVLPLVASLLVLGLASLPFVALGYGAWFYTCFGWFGNLVATLFQNILAWANSWPWGILVTGTPGLLVMIFIWSRWTKISKGKAQVKGLWHQFGGSLGHFLLVLALFLSSSCSYELGSRLSPWLNLTTLDVGHGDALHLTLPRGPGMLIDGGGGSKVSTTDWIGRRVLGNYLAYSGTSYLDTVLISHWHTDHYSGLLPVLATIPIGSLVTPCDPTLPPKMDSVQAEQTFSARRGRSFTFSGGYGQVVYPLEYRPEMANDPNLASTVLYLSYEHLGILFTGDLSASGQRILAASGMPEVDLLKVPHHGGKSLDPNFVAKLRPRYALISGAGPEKGQPRPETLVTLAEAKVQALRTDLNGNWRICSNGTSWHISCTAGKVDISPKNLSRLILAILQII